MNNAVEASGLVRFNVLVAAVVLVVQVVTLVAWGEPPGAAALPIGLAVGVCVTGFVRWIRPRAADRILYAHTLLFSAAAISMLLWAVRLFVRAGHVASTRFAWTPGILTLAFGYSGYLAERTFLAGRARRLHLVLAAAALPIDVAVLWIVLTAD